MKTIPLAPFAILFTLSAPVALAQDWAKAALEKSPRHQEWVTLKHDGRSLETFIVYPEAKEKAPAVVVIHEIFGLTDWVRNLADQLAAAGYIAIAPDLLSGSGPGGGGSDSFASTQDASKAISKLNPDDVTADLDAAAEYVKDLPASNGKLAVAGFCWGGGKSFLFATHRHDLSAAFVFYGIPPEKFDAITAPVYGFYAGNDERIGATIPATIEGMKKAAKTFEPVTYEGAGHGFMRAGEDPAGSEANKKARADGWKRWLSLLSAMGPPPGDPLAAPLTPVSGEPSISTTAAPARPQTPKRIVLAGRVMQPKLIHIVKPEYPQPAREAGITGTVHLHAIVARDGTMLQLEVVRGHTALVGAALQAVRQWRYQPTLLNGEPVEVDTFIDVVFNLTRP